MRCTPTCPCRFSGNLFSSPRAEFMRPGRTAFLTAKTAKSNCMRVLAGGFNGRVSCHLLDNTRGYLILVWFSISLMLNHVTNIP